MRFTERTRPRASMSSEKLTLARAPSRHERIAGICGRTPCMIAGESSGGPSGTAVRALVDELR